MDGTIAEQEVAVAADAPLPLPVTLTADGQHATLVFGGVLDTRRTRELEEQLTDPRLRQARTLDAVAAIEA